MEGTTTRLADLLAGLSLMSDLGFARPPEEAMRRCVLATAIARRMGLAEPEVADVYWTALLQHIGCTGFAHEGAAVYGDDLALDAAVAPLDGGRLREVIGFVSRAAAGQPIPARLRSIARTIAGGEGLGRRFAVATCEVGRATARRLGLGDGVRRGLQDVVEDWNGRAGARGLRGDEISLPARVTAVAFTVGLFRAAGVDAVVAALRARAGRLVDPEIVAVVLEHHHDLLDDGDRDPRESVLEAEPEPVRTIAPGEMGGVAAAVGDVADLKSPWFHGHSSGVATLATAAGERGGLDAADRSRLGIAALLHDVGRVGISNVTWERRGPLTYGDREQVRLHPYLTERILAGSETLRPMAAIAALHHERLDGSGYHRGATARDIPPEARILAAADAFDAMTHHRPHRPALTAEAAAGELQRESAAGRLDTDAVRWVVEAAGMPVPPARRRASPAGLTEREVEALRLVARGCTNAEVANGLGVSRRTAEHHVQHIYDKIGVSSRAAAALFAMEHSLLD